MFSGRDKMNSNQFTPMIPLSPVDNELPTANNQMDHVYICTIPDILPNDCVCRTLKIASNIWTWSRENLILFAC